MDDPTTGRIAHPAHSIQTAADLAALTGQRVWAVRQISRLVMSPNGSLVYTPSNQTLIVEWQVGPMLKAANNRPRDQTWLAVAEREEWPREHRLYNAHWTDTHLLRRDVRTLMVGGYLPEHKAGFIADRYGASAIFANQTDAISHRVYLALAEDYIEPAPGDETDDVLGIRTDPAPHDLYARTGQWANRTP